MKLRLPIQILFLLYSASFCCTVAAQNGYLINTRKLTVKEGLAHQEVYDIYQDSRGFMWMATRSGLSRYNGYTFINFTKEKNGLTSNNIHGVTEDDGGRIWLFSRTGTAKKSPLQSVDLLDIGMNKVTKFETAFPGCPFTLKDAAYYFVSPAHEIFFNVHGQLWRYTFSGGFKKIALPASFTPEDCAGPQAFWGTQNNRLVKTDRSGRVLFTAPVNDVAHTEITSARENFLNLITPAQNRNEVVVCSNNALGSLPAKLSEQYQKFVHYDENKKIVWATGPGSLSVFNRTGEQIYFLDNNTEEAFERGIRKLYIDKLGTAWLATEAGVFLAAVRKEKFSRYLYTERKGKKTDFIQCRGMLQYNSQLYVGTYKGCFKIDLPSGSTMMLDRLKENGTELGDRFTFVKTSSNKLFFGAKRPILANPETGKELTFIKGVKRSAWSLYADKHNRLLAGTDFGLLQYDPAKSDTVTEFTGYNQFTELAGYFVPGIIKDRSGTTWVVSSNGLYVLDEDKGITEHYGTAEKGTHKLITDNLQHLYQDASGTYWLSTGNAGLIKWNRGTGAQKQYSKDNGLSSNNLYAVYEDQKGFLWISSDYGLMRFNKNEEQVTVYTPEDGICHYEFNRISHYQAPDGHIYFGGLNGVTAFNPNDFYDTTGTRMNKVMISGFQQYIGASGNLADLTGQLLATNRIILNPSDRFFSLSLAVPDYINTTKTVYYYKIDGVDKDWIKTTSNEIRFGRQPYGRFTLRIKAQTADGNITEETRIALYSKRPWYLKWWVYALLALLAATAMRFFYRWRIHNLEQRKKELESTVALRTRQLEKDKATIEKQAEELKQMDEMKSKFFANVSHELRTPLTLIAGPVNRLLQQTGKSGTDHMYLSLMQQNVQQLQNRINEILDLSKLDADKLELNEEPVLLSAFLQPIIASFESIAQQKNISFLYRCRLAETLCILTDKEQLRKILNNLLSNAFKFTPAGGQVLVTVHDDVGQVFFKIADTGIGIPAGEQQYIFNRFYQVKENKNSIQGGTGIGLALTSELVALMKGRINLESEPGKGATFVVELPKKTASLTGTDTSAYTKEYVPEKLNTTAIIPAHRGATILLAEDNLNLQQFIQLELADYRIVPANNGFEALDQLQTMETLPHLIISDIMMPGMDGFALLEQLKAHEQFRKIPVIMLTARADLHDKLTALRIGVDDYMLKPFITEELKARVNNLLVRYHNRSYENELPEAAPREPNRLPVTENIPEPVNPAWLQQLEAVVLDLLNRQEGFTLDTLAEKTFVSKRQLQRNIKAETGLTANNYIKEIRLFRARHLLENKTFATIAEVSYAVGFNDQHYFSTIFAERFGKKPADYF